MTVLLDTCIIFDYLRKSSEAARFFESQRQLPGVSVVSVAELFAGARSQREEGQIGRLLATSKLFSVIPEIARRAGTFLRLYRQSHSIDIPDALIAATAEHHRLELATVNIKHFPMFPKLKRAY